MNDFIDFLTNYDASLSKLDNNDKNMLKDSADKDIREYKSVNQSGDCKQYFPKVLNSENGVVMAKDSYMVEMAPVVNETQEYVAAVEENVATYSSDDGIIEYQFESMNNGVKDYIVIKEKPDVYEYIYNINTQNVELKIRKNDKGIQVLDKKSKFMADSTMANNTLTVSNHLMSSYPYNSENRVFIDTDNLLTTQAFMGSGNTISDKYIEAAYLNIKETAKPAYYPTGTVRVGTVLEDWDSSSVTWNTQPDISEDYIAEFDSTGVEIRIIKLMNKSRKLIVNMVVKSMYKKKGESWETVIRRWLKSV